jgi:hypothetical protein
MKTYWGVEIWHHEFLTLPLYASHPGRSVPRERTPGTHCTEECVSPRTPGRGGEEKKSFRCHCSESMLHKNTFYSTVEVWMVTRYPLPVSRNFSTSGSEDLDIFIFRVKCEMPAGRLRCTSKEYYLFALRKEYLNSNN